MTEKELTDEIRKIYEDACKKIGDLLKQTQYKVFFDKYDFHKYVKHGNIDGIISSPKEILDDFINGRDDMERLVFASKENIEEEKKNILAEELQRCDDMVRQGKELIVKYEKRRKNLKNGVFENDD